MRSPSKLRAEATRADARAAEATLDTDRDWLRQKAHMLRELADRLELLQRQGRGD